MILVDTNVVSDGLKVQPNPRIQQWVDTHGSDAWISAITIAELYAGVELLPDGRRKEELRRAAGKAIDEFGGSCVAFDALAGQVYARIVGLRTRLGRPIGILDAQIAAIALSTGFTLATLKTKDFEGIDGLKVVDPAG